MAEKIQAQFINEQNGSLYYEIYFKFINKHEIDFSDYQRIERIVDLELNKIAKARHEKNNA